MSGTSDNIIKECSAVWSRLFDHKPFLQGETIFFIKEFEEKRGDREVENLFEILEKSTEIKDSLVDRLKHSSANNLPEFQQVLDQANTLCDQVIEERISYKPEQELKTKCEILEENNLKFEEELKIKFESVDENFQEKENLLKQYYQELSEKLNQSLNIKLSTQ